MVSAFAVWAGAVTSGGSHVCLVVGANLVSVVSAFSRRHGALINLLLGSDDFQRQKDCAQFCAHPVDTSVSIGIRQRGRNSPYLPDLIATKGDRQLLARQRSSGC